jgi:uncharacterized membrane protein
VVSRLAKHVDSSRIIEAIERAEQGTTGQLRVSVAPHFYGSVRKAAEKAFARMRLTHTPDRNGVLIFVVPSRREFVILGDVGVHEKVGQAFWDRVSAAIGERIRAASLTEGLIHGVEEAGRQLAAHFPRKHVDGSG